VKILPVEEDQPGRQKMYGCKG